MSDVEREQNGKFSQKVLFRPKICVFLKNNDLFTL